MKRLIVTADDVGLDRGMTEGAIRAHEQGIVTACSVVANGAAVDHALDRLRGVPSLETGAHLALVEERALSDGSTMPRSYREFLLATLTRRITIGWIEQELRAQIEFLLARGLPLAFVNGHQHLHAFPPVFRLVCRLAGEYGIKYVRFPRERRLRGGVARRAAVAVLGRLAASARASARPVAMNDATVGISEAGSFTVERVLALLEDVGDGVTELVTHPGLSVGGYAHWRYGWDVETTALCDDRVKQAVAARGIALIRPSDV